MFLNYKKKQIIDIEHVYKQSKLLYNGYAYKNNLLN